MEDQQQSQFKCKNCGGKVVFDTELQKMKCTMCDSVFEVSDYITNTDYVDNSERPDFAEWSYDENSPEAQMQAQDKKTLICESCGGEIIVDATQGATSCPFCGNAVVVPKQFSGLLKPDIILPFCISKEKAVKRLSEHVKRKRFVPKVFKNQQHISEAKGVYVPFWLFDGDCEAACRFNACKLRYWSSGNRDYTETSRYMIYREGKLPFQFVPVDASQAMRNDLMEAIEPFDKNKFVNFEEGYLSGFLANRYDVPLDDCKELANARIKKSMEDYIASTVQGYDSVTAVQSSINLSNTKVHYALYPVWLLTTKWQNKLYTFAVNGQSGKTAGEVPFNKLAYRMWFALVALICTCLTFAAAWLYWFLR